MQEEEQAIVDSMGRRGSFTSSTADPSRIEVRLDTGERLSLPRTQLIDSADGTKALQHSFESLLAGSELRIPVHVEELDVGTRSVTREQVSIKTKVTERAELVDLPLARVDVQIEHVPIGREVQAAAAPREQGDTWIIPVYEEVLFVEKRLMLREEIHVRRVRREVHEPQRIMLRREEIEVDRKKPDDSSAGRSTGGE